MKIHIAYEMRKGPWGGGNQLLKALRSELERRGVYSEGPDDADVVIFNSFPTGEEHRIRQIYRLKKRGASVIHRVDGPVSLIRDRDIEVDRLIFAINARGADGTVFQSDWSRRRNHDLGMPRNAHETVIINAPDPALFNTDGREPFDRSRRARIIATSWSPNPRKGFDYYAHLDRHLDWDRFEMTFVGRSPVTFENIRAIAPVSSGQLAAELKRHDIFITASRNDPCSNSLIEALHCGLPAVVLNDGGHPGIVGAAGETFNDLNEMLVALDRVAGDYERYRRAISLPDITAVASEYLAFAKRVRAARAKDVGFASFAGLLCRVYVWKLRHAVSFWVGRQ